MKKKEKKGGRQVGKIMLVVAILVLLASYAVDTFLLTSDNVIEESKQVEDVTDPLASTNDNHEDSIETEAEVEENNEQQSQSNTVVIDATPEDLQHTSDDSLFEQESIVSVESPQDEPLPKIEVVETSMEESLPIKDEIVETAPNAIPSTPTVYETFTETDTPIKITLDEEPDQELVLIAETSGDQSQSSEDLNEKNYHAIQSISGTVELLGLNEEKLPSALDAIQVCLGQNCQPLQENGKYHFHRITRKDLATSLTVKSDGYVIKKIDVSNSYSYRKNVAFIRGIKVDAFDIPRLVRNYYDDEVGKIENELREAGQFDSRPFEKSNNRVEFASKTYAKNNPVKLRNVVEMELGRLKQHSQMFK